MYNIVVPQINFTGKFSLNGNTIIFLIGNVTRDQVITHDGRIKDIGYKYPVTLVPVGYYSHRGEVHNDNIYNGNPNFTSNGLTFTVTDMDGNMIHYTLFTENHNNYVNIQSSTSTSTIPVTILIRDHESLKFPYMTHEEKTLYTNMGMNFYSIISDEYLLNITVVVKGNIITHLIGYIGDSPVSILRSGIFPQKVNTNMFVGSYFTSAGISFTSSCGSTVTCYNLFKSDGTDLLRVSCNHLDESATVIVAIPIHGYEREYDPNRMDDCT